MDSRPFDRIIALDSYQEAMQRTYKPERKPNHATGVAGETAEILDLVFRQVDALRAAGRLSELVKKDYYHARPADRDKIRDELGDLLWYISALATDYDLSLSDIAQANVEKLRRRYPDGFVTGGGIR